MAIEKDKINSDAYLFKKVVVLELRVAKLKSENDWSYLQVIALRCRIEILEKRDGELQMENLELEDKIRDLLDENSRLKKSITD